MNEKNHIDFTDRFSLASPKKQRLLPIAERDWIRIKELVKRFALGRKWMQNASSICAGAFISDVFFLFSVWQANITIPVWMNITSWVILVVSLLLAVVFFLLDYKDSKDGEITKQDILMEIKNIEDSFEIENDENT